MNRRDVIKAFAGAVASVAIGMRVANGMPTLPDPNIVAMTVKITFDSDEVFSDWRCVYGSPG